MDLFIKVFVSVASAVILSAFGYFTAKLKHMAKKHHALERGVQAMLRDRIIQMFNYYNDKHTLPIYARENLDSLHNEYKTLGGNGVIDELVDKLMKMPVDKLPATAKGTEE